MKVTCHVNGEERTFHIDPNERLIDTLRKHHIVSVRRGCDTTSCGVCTVLIDQKPMPACTVLSARVDQTNITTVEGIPKFAQSLSQYFGQEGADQCGFCNPGIALSVYAMMQNETKIDEAMIRHYLVGHLCRCTGYVSQTKAIKAFLEGRK